nr:hypothetical protein B0A51_08553 [Rachicladosporium sp. CCFEE 5018]
MSSRYPTPKSSRSGSLSSEIEDYISSREESTSTQSSYNLSPTNQYRTLHAATARAQVASAPARQPRQGYPKTFDNREELTFQSKPPYREFPTTAQKSTDYGHDSYKSGAKPGPLRAIYNNSDRSAFEVAYHNKTLGNNGKNFEKAAYRPRDPGSSSVAAALAAQRDRDEGWTVERHHLYLWRMRLPPRRLAGTGKWIAA